MAARNVWRVYLCEPREGEEVSFDALPTLVPHWNVMKLGENRVAMASGMCGKAEHRECIERALRFGWQVIQIDPEDAKVALQQVMSEAAVVRGITGEGMDESAAVPYFQVNAAVINRWP